MVFRHKAGGCITSRVQLAAWVAAALLLGPGAGLGEGVEVDAGAFGFSPASNAIDNVASLQRALQGGQRTVRVTRPGDYELNDTVYLDDDTRVVFAPGVALKKAARYGFVLCNRGALTRTWNRNIRIDGLHIRVNGKEGGAPPSEPTWGLRGQLTLYGVRNAEITRFTCLDLEPRQFCIHVCAFEDLLIDGFEIRGKKDGIHLGAGRRFTVRNGICETHDDAIALNAQDYPTSQPMQGDIEDGVVENIVDEAKPQTGGNSVRLLTGAWPDWRPGLRVRNGDTVRCGMNVYRVVLPSGSPETASVEAPRHAVGTWRDAAGIGFFQCSSDGATQANIRRVVFRNMTLRDNRTSFKFAWDICPANRAIHPETPKDRWPICEAAIENCRASATNAPFLWGNSNVRVSARGVTVAGTLLDVNGRGTSVEAKLEQVTLLRPPSDKPDLVFTAEGNLDLSLRALSPPRDLLGQWGKRSAVRVRGDASLASLQGLAPRAGDRLMEKGVRKVYDGRSWTEDLAP